MKTNPTFRASYPLSTSASKKNTSRKQKVIAAIFKNSQKVIPPQKKLPTHKLTVEKSSSSPNFSKLIEKDSKSLPN